MSAFKDFFSGLGFGLPSQLSNMYVRRKHWAGDPVYVFNSNRQNTWNKRSYVESFNCVPEVNAVINLKGNAFSNGVFRDVDGKGVEDPNSAAVKLLNNPNWFQAKGEFMKQTKIGHEVFGNEYLHFLVPFGFNFDPARIKALYTIMGDMMTVEYEEDVPFFFFSKDNPPKKIKYCYVDDNGQHKELPEQSIIHFNDNRVGGTKPTDKNLLLGQSKLEVLSAPINNIRAAYESRGIIITERGANGAWVNNSSKDQMGGVVPLRPKEISKLQAAFSGYGTMGHQRQFIIAPRDIRFEQAGNFRPKDLGLFDETEEDFRKIQDAYGTPPELFARPDGSTYENVRQARKGLYINTTIPEAVEWTNGLSAKFYPNGERKIILDYSHLEIFQDDIKIKAEKTKAVIENLSLLLRDGMISDEEYREEIFKHGLGNGKPLPPKATPIPAATPASEDGGSEDEEEDTEE